MCSLWSQSSDAALEMTEWYRYVYTFNTMITIYQIFKHASLRSLQDKKRIKTFDKK